MTASVDQNEVELHQEIHLNIRITGLRGSVQAPQLPSLEGFDVFYSGRSSKFSFVNGISEAMTEFNYVLVPKMSGQFILLPVEIKIGSQVYKTNEINIKVIAQQTSSRPLLPPMPFPASRPQPVQQAPASSFSNVSATDELDQNIFLKVTPSQIDVYMNQQLVLIYSLYTRYDTRYEGFVEEPQTSGFWIEEFPMDPNIGKDTETISGQKYVRADVKKLALFPTSPGEYEIKPGVVKTSVQIEDPSNSMMDEFFRDSFFNSGGLFGKRVEKLLAPKSLRIHVKPLPEAGKPESFKGAVGDFRMATGVDKRVVNQNEAVTLQITLEGEGNIETLSAPALPEIKETKIYEADTQTQLFKAQNLIAGKKTFEIVIIPGEAGELKIPSIEFSYFNPKLARYIVLKSDVYHIKVNPSSSPAPAVPREFMQTADKKSIRLETEDIQYIKERFSGDPHTILSMGVSTLVVINIFLTLLTVGLFYIRRRNEYLDQNISLKRTLFAKKFAARGLSRLNRLAKQGLKEGQSDESFFDESAKILNQYLSDKLNLSTYGLTQNLIEQHLMERNLKPDLISKIQDCYAICDQIRFGKMGAAEVNRDEMIGRIREIIYALERKNHV